MPTIRPRHVITETEEVARTLDTAARIWPDLRDDRAALLRRVIAHGGAELDAASASRRAERRRAIRETAGLFAGLYPPG